MQQGRSAVVPLEKPLPVFRAAGAAACLFHHNELVPSEQWGAQASRMFKWFVTGLKKRLSKFMRARKWGKRILVVGPVSPVDGDSVSCCYAVVEKARANGLEAYTLPTVATYPQLDWILQKHHIHPALHGMVSEKLTTTDLQACYDALLRVWRPDEIVLVDGQPDRLGFNPRGVKVFTIDHHVDNGVQDDQDAYIQPGSSAGVHLIKKFGIYDAMLVVSILTDTFWLRQNLPSEAIEALYLLRKYGGLTDEVLIDLQRKLRVPGDPRVIDAIRAGQMHRTADSVFIVLKDTNPEVHRGVCAEMGYFFKHLCVVCGNGYVSFRTADPEVNVAVLARERWSGGGHPNMAAGRVQVDKEEQLSNLHEDFNACIRRQPLPERVS